MAEDGTLSTLSSAPRRAASSADTAGGRFLRGRSPVTNRRGHYTALVAIEYLACMVMVLLSLGLVGKNNTKTDILLTPVVAMVRLTAVSLLFFILAILSTGEQMGRISAAFGGLVTAGVSLNATNEWRSLAGIFNFSRSSSSSSSKTSATSSSSKGQS